MPELPEVESIKLQLDKFIVGHAIEAVDIRYEKCFRGNKKQLIGGKVVRVRRFGKALVIDLDSGYSMVIHIKLTGQLIYRGPNLNTLPEISDKVKDGLRGKHTHVIFHLDGDAKLYYNDVRKFGWIEVIKTAKVKDQSYIKNLGDEFLKDLTLKSFKKIVSSTSRKIKTLLMDQKKIAGVGNIYANDALWLSKIHPERKSNELSDKEAEALFDSIEKVLKEGIKRGGASDLSYVTPDGTEGEYQEHFLAYGKEGEKCPRCRSGVFKKIKISGRGTYFCPKCQRK
ncbi:MAG: bifunctional DNA-formamidopyrimidine glycosylase/DNA-(apurinic or apyrimidinic site) lyase [Candidatus Woesebacteria bacterium]|jgi:formamidopyrimidine-DNA glycosylase